MSTASAVVEARREAIAVVRLLFEGRHADAELLIRTADDPLEMAGSLAWLSTAVLMKAGDPETVDRVLRELTWIAAAE